MSLEDLRQKDATKTASFTVPYDVLATCTKQRFDLAHSAQLTHQLIRWDDPEQGIARVAMLMPLNLATAHGLFEFTFIRQNAATTFVEFRVQPDHAMAREFAEPAWQDMQHCAIHHPSHDS